MLTEKPEQCQNNDYMNKLYDEHRDQFNSEGREPIRVALMSDLHLDYDYQEGMNSDCGKPLCCRSDSGLPATPDKAAGKWGDFMCDLNERTMINMLQYIKNEIKPDVVLWGGDSIPHNVDTLTFDSNVQIMRNVTAEVLTQLDDLRIYPTIGNHDTYPQDIIRMSIPKQNQAINQWIDTWDPMIPDPEQNKLFKDWGYYSQPFLNKDGKQLGDPFTKIISLNNNICYHFNWESMTTFEDPGGMLEWLEVQLNDLEKVNGTAIILSHVPNIDECNRQFGRRYHAILDRYQHVIRWGLYAHIHQEQFQVQTDLTFGNPIGINFIIGSATTFTGKPPSFNVVNLDPVSMLPISFETYAFDLDHANKFDEPKWDLMYNYTETYGMKDLSPQSFYDLSKSIYYDEEVAKAYRNHRYIDGPGVNKEAGCDFECRMIMYCQTVSNDYDEWQFCRNRDKFDPFSISETLLTFEQSVDHTWFTNK